MARDYRVVKCWGYDKPYDIEERFRGWRKIFGWQYIASCSTEQDARGRMAELVTRELERQRPNEVVVSTTDQPAIRGALSEPSDEP